MEIPWSAFVLNSLEGDIQEYEVLEHIPGILVAVDQCSGISENSLSWVSSIGFRFPEKERWVGMLPFMLF